MNLIVTCPRHFESETREEVRKILKEFGDELPEIFLTDMAGILTANSKLNPIEIVRKFRDKVGEEPWALRYIKRIIPIQKSFSGNLDEIVKNSLNITSSMEKERTYRITIEKRNSSISSRELISKIAKNLENKVDLENPDVILLIEIIGNLIGISLLKKEDILSIDKEKRVLSD